MHHIKVHKGPLIPIETTNKIAKKKIVQKNAMMTSMKQNCVTTNNWLKCFDKYKTWWKSTTQSFIFWFYKSELEALGVEPTKNFKGYLCVLVL